MVVEGLHRWVAAIDYRYCKSLLINSHNTKVLEDCHHQTSPEQDHSWDDHQHVLTSLNSPIPFKAHWQSCGYNTDSELERPLTGTTAICISAVSQHYNSPCESHKLHMFSNGLAEGSGVGATWHMSCMWHNWPNHMY